MDTHSKVGRGGGWVAGQLAIGVVAIALGALGPGWPDPWRPLAFAGWVLMAAGLAMVVAGGGVLGSSLTPFPRPTPGARLREHGVYRFVRHPMYGGTIVLFTGFSLVSSPLALVATAALAVFLDLKSRREEEWLVERHPGYEDYRRTTRWKFVPGLR